MIQVSASDVDSRALYATVKTVSALLASLEGTAPRDHVPAPTNENFNALDLAHDTASLIRALSTKLSLLIINKPFTPSAVNKILKELLAGPISGLASAIELCHPARYTKVMSKEVQCTAKRVFSELNSLVQHIPQEGQILGIPQQQETNSSLAVTGVLWDACDRMMAMKNLEVGGILVRKAQEQQELLRDALEELRRWADEAPEESDDKQKDDDHRLDAEDAQAALDDMFGSQRCIPRNDPEKIRARLDSTLKKLRLIVLMYEAVVKRRLRTLPAIPYAEPPGQRPELTSELDTVKSLDELMDVLSKIPEITDELAGAFYELDSPEIDIRMNECFLAAFSAAALLAKDWEGDEDAFTTWANKFQLAMKKG